MPPYSLISDLLSTCFYGAAKTYESLLREVLMQN